MEILSYRDEVKCKTILKIVVDDDLEDIEEAKRLIAEDTREQLRKYWKIEEELGIPLEVLFKALKDGIWYEHKYYGVQFCDFVNLLDGGYWRLSIVNPKDDFEHDLDLGLEDYGKTWALTREELE